VNVTTSAQLATLGINTGSGALSATNNVTLEVGGALGKQQVTLTGGTTVANIAAAINQYTKSTGVTATVSSNSVRLDSTDFGSSQFVSLKVINEVTGNLAGSQLSGTYDNGRDATVNINGAQAEVDGLKASVRTANLDLSVDLKNSATVNTTNGTTSFTITGGGAKFQLGSTVNEQSQSNIGIRSIATGNLGNSTDGFLSSLKSGGLNSLLSGNTTQAQRIITDAIGQVSTLRGRIGAFQKNILDSNVNSLNVALENVTASESSIRDADFATETAALTRAQILVQANTSILSQANSSPQNVLSLLKG
jgi:flagellin